MDIHKNVRNLGISTTTRIHLLVTTALRTFSMFSNSPNRLKLASGVQLLRPACAASKFTDKQLIETQGTCFLGIPALQRHLENTVKALFFPLFIHHRK